MELEDFLLTVHVTANVEDSACPTDWDKIGIAHRNAHYSIWDQLPVRRSDITVNPEEVDIGFFLFNTDHFALRRQTCQHIFSPQSVANGMSYLAAFSKLQPQGRETLERLVQQAEDDPSISVIFVEDDTQKKRFKGAIAFRREVAVDRVGVGIFAFVRFLHVEGNAANRAALIHSLFEQLKLDVLTASKSMKQFGHEGGVSLEVINEADDDETLEDVYETIPEWITEEIADDLQSAERERVKGNSATLGPPTGR